MQPVRKAPRRFRNVLAKVLAPTAAFLARVIHRGDRDKKASMPTGESLHLSAVDIILKSPQVLCLWHGVLTDCETPVGTHFA